MSNISICILNRDRLSCTKELYNQFRTRGYDNIHIVDLGSTYPPLLDWYRETAVNIHYFNNIGHKGIWENGFLKQFKEQWVCVTDSDVELDPDTPPGFIEELTIVSKDFRINKAGLAIRFSDITNPALRKIIVPIERQYWQRKLDHKRHSVFAAPVDTTLCVIRPELPFQYTAVRVADWPLKHIDWYSNFSNLSPEEEYYIYHADRVISTYAGHYFKWLEETKKEVLGL